MDVLDKIVLALIGACVICICALSAGCNSTPVNESTAICGIMTDSNDVPVAGYEIYVNGIYKCATNQQGLFILSGVDGNDCKITAEKRGYEKIVLEGKSFSPKEVVCISARNLMELSVAVERNILTGDLISAEKQLEKIGSKDSGAQRILFLKSVLLYEQEQYLRAYETLGLLKEKCWNSQLEKYEMLLLEKLDFGNEIIPNNSNFGEE